MNWKVGRDLGEWFVYEVGDQWGGYATEAEAVDELRRIQTNESVAAETDLKLSKQRVAHTRKVLSDPPDIRRMKRQKR